MAHHDRSGEKETVPNAVKDQNLAKALAGLKDGTYANVRQASKSTGTPRSTLRRQLKRGLMHRKANEHRQQLSPDEERALVQWVEHLSCTGNPVRHSFLCELAQEIRRPHVENTNYVVNDLGIYWVSHFFARNPSLQSKVAKNNEAARKEVTENQLQNWFNVFKCVVDEYNIEPGNIYNMDETGSILAPGHFC